MLYGKVRLTNYYKFSRLVLDSTALSSHQRRFLRQARLSDESVYYSHGAQKINKKTSCITNRASPRCRAHSFTSVQERGTEWCMSALNKDNLYKQEKMENERESEKKRASDKLPQQSKNTAIKEHADMMVSSSSNKYTTEKAQLQLIWYLLITVSKGLSCKFRHSCRPPTQ